MNKTKIDWCHSTWNPVTGCLHACKYCYARGIAKRFGGHMDLDYFIKTEEDPAIKDQKIHVLDEPMATYAMEARRAPYPFYFEPTFHRYKLNEYENKKGRNIFVCSMADLFGEWVPDEWIQEVFAACQKAPQHNYLFLTKNPKRYVELMNRKILPEADNMWFGISVTNAKQMENAADVAESLPVKFRVFLSIEPIHEDIANSRGWVYAGFGKNFDWIIIGAETGKRKERVIPKREWIKRIVKYCSGWRVPVFMKESLTEIWGEPLIQEFPKDLINSN